MNPRIYHFLFFTFLCNGLLSFTVQAKKIKYPPGPFYIVKKNGDTLYAKDKESILIDRRKTYLDKDLLRFGFVHLNNKKYAIKGLRCASMPMIEHPDSSDIYYICGGREKYFLKAKFRGRINIYELADQYESNIGFTNTYNQIRTVESVERTKLKVFMQIEGEKKTHRYTYKNLLKAMKNNEQVTVKLQEMKTKGIKLVEKRRAEDGTLSAGFAPVKYYRYEPYVNYDIIPMINH